MEGQELDPIRLPLIRYERGSKDELKYAAMVQVLFLMLSWGATADAQGTPLTEDDVIEILKNASHNYGPNYRPNRKDLH